LTFEENRADAVSEF